jgi:hypothetical protein
MNKPITLRSLALAVGLISTLSFSPATTYAQGTAFTYQGRLNDGSNPANGNYDLRFTVFPTSGIGSAIAGPLTNTATLLSNGLFTVTLDFGVGSFTGQNLWLEIAARTNGGSSGFATLSPRQRVTPVPYSIGASSLLAPLTGSLLQGTYPGILTLNNAANQLSGSFTGNGAGVTNLNASQLLRGTVPDARLSANVALLTGSQAFSGAKIFSNTVTAAGGLRLNDTNLWLRNDNNHGLGWFGNGKPFAATSNVIDGPVLFGFSGGALGTEQFGTERIALLWTSAGNVGIGTNNPQSTLHVNGTVTANAFQGNGAGLSNLSNVWQVGGNTGANPANGAFLGTSDNLPLELKANGQRGLRIEAVGYSGTGCGIVGTMNIIGGNSNNFVAPGIGGAVIAGGGGNTVANCFGTISGGSGNSVGSYYAAIGGGSGNQANGPFSMVPGGHGNTALGNASFAAGFFADAGHDNAFVWSCYAPNSSGFQTHFHSTGVNQFNVRATGGFRFVTAIDGAGNSTKGATLASGGESWGTLSDRNAKKNFQPVDGKSILEKLARIPVQRWNYKGEPDDATPHVGPMAQDFKAAFFPSRDDKVITTLEFDGVELAAIQGLNQKLEEQRVENAELKRELAELKKVVQTLAARH